MWKIEQKLREYIEIHKFPIAALTVTVLALYLRKVAVWWNYENLITYYDGYTISADTMVWSLVKRGMEYVALWLGMTPLHVVKWLCALGDLAYAGLVAFVLKRSWSLEKRTLYYILILFCPLLFLRGVIWTQPDVLALFCLGMGELFCEKKSRIGKVCFIVLAYSICPWFLFVFGWKELLEGMKKEFQIIWILPGVLFCNWFAGWILGGSIGGSLLGSIRFLYIHPESGNLFSDWIEWGQWMLYDLGVPLSILIFDKAFRDWKWLPVAILSQCLFAVHFGMILFG